MRQVTVTANSSGDTPAVVLDQYITPFQVTYSKSGAGGTVQVTATNPYPYVNQDFTTASFSWIPAPTTAPSGTNFLGHPYRAIRLTGAAEGDTFTVIQSGVK